MAMRTKMKVRRLQQAAKIRRKSMKILMFFGTLILIRFGGGVGWVLGGQMGRIGWNGCTSGQCGPNGGSMEVQWGPWGD